MNSFWKKFCLVLFFLALVFCYFKTKDNRQTNLVTTASRSSVKVIQTQMTASVVDATSSTDELFSVERVIDGDTIVVLIDGKDETIRLLGMDTPETVDPRKPVQCFGPEASDETKSLLDGREVSLEKDQSQADRDKYGRLLRYVFRDDGLFIDEYLVKEGFAYEYTYMNVPYKFQSVFKTDQRVAKTSGVGLWATTTCNGKR